MAKEQPFKNREITQMFDEVTETLKRIETQTTNTNGKVAEIQKWRERVNGGVLVAVFVLPTFFTVIGWMAYQITTFDKQIQEALSVYEVPQ